MECPIAFRLRRVTVGIGMMAWLASAGLLGADAAQALPDGTLLGSDAAAFGGNPT